MSRHSPSPSASPSALVTLSGVAARTSDGSTLFHDLTLAFGHERTGLVGRNGVGKTTLLRLISGEADPAEGTVARAGTVGVLTQAAASHPDEAVADTLGVASALEVVTRVLAGEGSGDDLAEADWTLEARIEEALAEVGLAGIPLNRATMSLSGGEQTRLRLAALLMSRPDLILLDEPTNNLDAEAKGIICDVLGRWPGGAVIVSHDRNLLRRMDRIVELTTLGSTVYGGGYDLYAERKTLERAAARDLDAAEHDAARVSREAQLAVEKKARRDRAGRAKAMKGDAPKILLGASKQRAEESSGRENRLAERKAEAASEALTAARSRIERLRSLDIPMPPTGLAAGRTVLVLEGAGYRLSEGRAAPSVSSAAPPIHLHNCDASGEERVILTPVSLRLIGPERLAITGPNGAGKTTLLRLITGDIEPTEGSILRPIEAALLDQHSAILRLDETLLDAYQRLNPGATPNVAYAALARFLFRNISALKRVGDLSGGERLRAAMACVMMRERPPQLLILDEPTNHLDLESIEAVESALRAYDGCLVVVSHDPDFLAAIGIERTFRLLRP